jgi:hypothetical protein
MIHQINEIIDILEENEQISHLKINGWLVKYIKNPSHKVIIASLNQNGENIRYINEPSEELQLLAVRNLKYFDHIEGRNVIKYVKSEKAKELYEKIKKVRGIIQ